MWLFTRAVYICKYLLHNNEKPLTQTITVRPVYQFTSAAINICNQPQSAVKVMAHLLVAQQVWLLRCQNLPAPGGPLWPDWQAMQLKYVIEQNYTAWQNHLSYIPDNELSNSITYYNTKGELFHNTLLDIVSHVLNHGTHHRAQVGLHLKQAGFEQEPMDYIMYVRTQKL
jgi:uncharacterized damage-inducible protein DinB